MRLSACLRWPWLALLFGLSACQQPTVAPVTFHADGRPPLLSDWHVLTLQGDQLGLNQGVLPYDLNSSLFTDYAHKLRTLWMPAGVAARYNAEGSFEFPVGTIISKTFYYPLPAAGLRGEDAVSRSYDADHGRSGDGLDRSQVRLIETRLLVHRETGWVALPYVWNAAQDDARLMRTGDVVPLQLVADDGDREAFSYVVPDENQCASCHARDWVTREIEPIGPRARHLNRDFDYAAGSAHQFARWTAEGYLSGAPLPEQAPRNAVWNDVDAALAPRARAYLDINCSHCHNPKGSANTTGLTLDMSVAEDRHLGLCKPPVAAGRGTGDHLYDIVPGHADRSILTYRMATAEPGVMMPEIGRSTVHAEGVKLVSAWINAQPGDCSSVP